MILFMASLNFCHSTVQKGYAMYSNYWLAAISGCGLMLITLGTASAQQSLRPELILDVDAPQEVNAQPNFVMAQPLAPFAIPFRSTMGESAYAAAKQQANSAYAPGVSKPFPLAPTPLGPPVIKTNNFNGHTESDGLFPPDTHGAIGANHFVEVTNSHFDVFSKASPPTLVKSVTLATFFSYTAETLFDPRVVYDQTWQRWIVSAVAFPESTTVQRLFIGISKTSDPTGEFFIYNVDVDFFNNNDFYDFPQLGIDQDAVLFTANIFNSNFHPLGCNARAAHRSRPECFDIPDRGAAIWDDTHQIYRDEHKPPLIDPSRPVHCDGIFLRSPAKRSSIGNGSSIGYLGLEICECEHPERDRPLADPHHQLFWVSLAVFLPYQHLDQRSQAERILPREWDVG
jgi:hypothetical protein